MWEKEDIFIILRSSLEAKKITIYHRLPVSLETLCLQDQNCWPLADTLLWHTYMHMYAHIHILKEAIEFEITSVSVFEMGKYKLLLCVFRLCFPFKCIPQYLCSDSLIRRSPMLLQCMGSSKAEFTFSCQGKDALTATKNKNSLISLPCSFCSQVLS